MAVPDTDFREIPIDTAATAIDTAAERLAAVAGEVEKSTGSGNEVDFGTLNISTQAQQSLIKLIFWRVTADGGNTLVSVFKLWQSSEGFDIADSANKAMSSPFATTSANPTITTGSAHGLAIGDTVEFNSLSGMTPATALDGVFVVATVPTTTTFTLFIPNAISVAPTVGNVTLKGSGNSFIAISGADQGSPALTVNYVADAVAPTTAAAPTYQMEPLPVAEPGAQNVYPSDEGSSMALSTTSDDVVAFALMCNIALGETTGTYKGTDSGFENQLSFKYTYS